MYKLIQLHSCDYLNKISIKTNMATNEGNSQNEMWDWTNDEIAVAVQSWLWVLVEFIAQSVRASERNSVVVGSNPTQASFLQLLLKIVPWLIPHVISMIYDIFIIYIHDLYVTHIHTHTYTHTHIYICKHIYYILFMIYIAIEKDNVESSSQKVS